MKAYYDAGLKSIAQASGYPTNQMKACSNSKRTHLFLLEVWEALYRAMMESYLEHGNFATGKNVQDAIHKSLEHLERCETFHKTFNETLGKLKQGIAI